MPFYKETVSQLSFDELKEIFENGTNQPLLIDVRELEEYEDGHIPGVPLIPMSELPDLIDQFRKHEEYIFICRSGRRSHEVSKFFKQNGIHNVHNYADGMLGWELDKKQGQEWIIKNVKELYQEGGNSK